MASLEGTQTRYLLRTGVVEQRTGVTGNLPIAIRIRAKAAAGVVTSVTVTTATNIVFVSTANAAETYAFSTYTTVGALVGAINAGGNFEAKVLDALNSDLVTSAYVTGGITAGTDSNGVVSWDITHLPSTAQSAGLYTTTTTLTGNRDWDTNWFNAEKVGQHRVVLQEFDYYATLGGAADNLVRFYIRRGTPGRTETQKFGALSVSGTLTAISFAGGVGFLSGRDGDEIICRVQDGTSISVTSLFVRATGYVE